jgi:hypothetical protein
MAWYLKYYECSACGTKWTDEWSCACNDRCPNCDTETEPSDVENLTCIVRSSASGTFSVMLSPDSAEGTPDYEQIGAFGSENGRRYPGDRKR